jgi:hypothetical protein
VHWLKAKARRDRWAEELVLLSSEMDWAVAFLQNQAKLWNHRARALPNDQRTSDDARQSIAPEWLPNEGFRGHISYAFRQEQMWLQFAAMAIEKFSDIRK